MTLVLHGADHLGNHVPGLVHHDRVALAHVLAADLVDVVERRASDGGAGDHHGVELGDRREDAGATHLHANLAQDRSLLLGRKLERDGPPRRSGREAEHCLAVEGVDLHHDAVDVVVELVSVRERVGAVGVDLARARHALGVRVDRESARTEPVEKRTLGGDREGTLVSHRVDERLEVAVGGDLGVLLAERPCGSVPGIGEGLLARGITLLVQADEAVLGHVHLAAHLDGVPESAVGHARQAGASKLGRDVVNRESVLGHVLAHRAVAACRRADENAVAIGERDA